MMRKRHAAIAILCGALSITCGSRTTAPPSNETSTPPTAPTPPPSDVANMAGKWVGTISSANFATRSITLEVFQTGTCVDGIWESSPSEWVGAISGNANSDSYNGLMSIERTGDNGVKCAGSALVSGSVGQTAIKWTGSGFNGDCAGGLPQDVVVTLRRP